MPSRFLLKRPLVLKQILVWADAYKEAKGPWPTKASGGIIGAKFETWLGVDAALRRGMRGLPGGSSLAQLLARERGARNVHDLPPLTESIILHWADRHYERTGAWPTAESGPILDSAGDKWSHINTALEQGQRGLPGSSSLARLLAKHRGVRNRKGQPPLTEEQILTWADLHFQRTGRWPTARSGPILDAPGETWMAAQMALHDGLRGLPGGSSLPLLFAEKRSARNTWTRPNFSLSQILAWADAFHQRTVKWPNSKSGPIPEAPQETWSAVNHALRRGTRGLPGGLSLAQLLATKRGARNQASVPPLSLKGILAWADAHFRRTGSWPAKESGSIPEAPGETWMAVDAALRAGNRSLPGGSSLPRLLQERRKRKNIHALLPLSKKKILRWADAHFHRHGKWPTTRSGPVQDASHERWDLIDNALRLGLRGLQGGSSLLSLLAKKRGVRHCLHPPPLSPEEILVWAELHYERTGRWPKDSSGPITDAIGETWAAVDRALRLGKRGFPGGSSLAKLLASPKNGNAR
jgi:hypothetical protein